MFLHLTTVLRSALSALKSRQDLVLENLVLRQLSILKTSSGHVGSRQFWGKLGGGPETQDGDVLRYRRSRSGRLDSLRRFAPRGFS